MHAMLNFAEVFFTFFFFALAIKENLSSFCFFRCTLKHISLASWMLNKSDITPAKEKKCSIHCVWLHDMHRDHFRLVDEEAVRGEASQLTYRRLNNIYICLISASFFFHPPKKRAISLVCRDTVVLIPCILSLVRFFFSRLVHCHIERKKKKRAEPTRQYTNFNHAYENILDRLHTWDALVHTRTHTQSVAHTHNIQHSTFSFDSHIFAQHAEFVRQFCECVRSVHHTFLHWQRRNHMRWAGAFRKHHQMSYYSYLPLSVCYLTRDFDVRVPLWAESRVWRTTRRTRGAAVVVVVVDTLTLSHFIAPRLPTEWKFAQKREKKSQQNEKYAYSVCVVSANVRAIDKTKQKKKKMKYNKIDEWNATSKRIY